MWGCRFYNFFYTVHFDTKEAAEEYGRKSGFQYVVEKYVEPRK